jgi:hypothetical protein
MIRGGVTVQAKLGIGRGGMGDVGGGELCKLNTRHVVEQLSSRN